MTQARPQSFSAAAQTARSEELNKMVRAAALQVDPKGRLKPLALKSGVSYNGLVIALRRGWFSPGMACALEIAVGRDVLKKESLCPHKFPVR